MSPRKFALSASFFLVSCGSPAPRGVSSASGPTVDVAPEPEAPPSSPPAASVPPAHQAHEDQPEPIAPDEPDVPVAATRRIPEGTKILHVGDSFAGALGLPLGKLLEEQGVHSVLKHTDASYLTDWAWDGNLQKYIWKYNPDLIVITLGANELGIAEPERREKTIKKIVATVGERPCLWVAIPLWHGKHNELMDVIERHVGPCVFMDTNRLIDVDAMPRISDGIHPTGSARQQWARFVVEWLAQHRSLEGPQPWTLVP